MICKTNFKINKLAFRLCNCCFQTSVAIFFISTISVSLGRQVYSCSTGPTVCFWNKNHYIEAVYSFSKKREQYSNVWPNYVDWRHITFKYDVNICQLFFEDLLSCFNRYSLKENYHFLYWWLWGAFKK